ncbi:hypothetical protein DFLDMN_005524 [Cupriavidus sp. H19C3]
MIVALRQQAVGARVPCRRIDAVGNRAEHIGTVVEQAVQPVTKMRRADFARVGMADGGDAIGVPDACLEKVDLAPELDAVRTEAVVVQAQHRRDFHREYALERQVVDGADGRDMQAALAHQQRRQAGMPVVCVHEARHRQRRFAGGNGRGRMGQRGKALGVVAEVAAGGIHVERPRAVVQRRAIQQDDAGAAVRHPAFEQPGRAVPGRQRHRQAYRAKTADVACRGDGPRVAGHENGHVGAALM